jgi:hypothetical protein
MKAGPIKQKLADMILDLVGEGFSIDPTELRTNKQGNKFNGCCSWTGYVYENALLNRSNNAGVHAIHSFSSMTRLVRHGSICFLSGGLRDGEISEKQL